MLRTLVAIFLLARLTLEECIAGCLKCNERDECLFCDFKNNYKIQGISCQAVTINNCSLIDISGNCLSCKEKFYLDKATNKCVEIKAGGVANCIRYSGASECSACEAGFYVFEAQCKAVPTPVANCTLADSNDPKLCLQCSPGYILVPDRTNCTKITEIDNCSSYSIASCQTCKAGYLLNTNKYLEDIYQLTSSEAQFNLLSKINYDMTDYKDQGYFATCSKITIQNCAEVQDIDKCKTCNEGFYLDDKLQCQPYPLEGIANCAVYGNATSCVECVANFFPETASTCSVVTEQPNCVTYSTKATSTICTSCVKEYYLNSDKKCVLRDQSKDILKCATTDPNADLCQTCITGHATTSDRLACLPEITMCETYLTSSKSDQQLTCTKCQNGFYYDATAKKCQTGSVENCLTYSQSAVNTCTVCKNGFYLSGSNCLKHSAQNNCTTYDPVISNKCSACQTNFFLFTPQTTCVQANVIEKCSSNQDLTNCAVCQDGFKLTTTTPKKCEQITSPSFCLQVDPASPNNCVKCQVGYFIKAGTCVLPYQIFSTNCESNNANGLISESVLSCRYCKPNALPWNYKNGYICINKNRLDQTKLIANCLRYKIDSNGNYACNKCPDAMVLKTDGTCGDVCGAGQALKPIEVNNYVTPGSPSTDFDNFAVTRTRLCFTPSGNAVNCLFLYPDIFTHTTRSASEASYACRKCADGFVKYILPNQVTNIDDPDKSKEPRSPLSAYPGIGCKSNPTRGTPAVSATIIYCEYYAEIIPSNWGCIKCQHGFSGKVIEISTGNGYIESCEKLTTCDDNAAKIYDGLILRKSEVAKYSTVLGAYYSCHACLNAGSIPYLAISFSAGNLPKLQKFGFTTTTGTFTAGGNTGIAVDCYAQNTPSSFGLTAEKYTTVANCGLGIINVSSAMNAEDATKPEPATNKVGVFCYACLPGFKPTRIAADTMAPLMVHVCTAIANCQSSTWFNACSKCNSNFAYRYNPATKMVEYDTCISFSSDPNCHAVDNTGINPVCKYCNKGFNLNADKFCETLIAVQCADPSYLNPQIFDVTYDTDFHGTGLFLMPQGPGCNQCSTDNLGLFIATDTFYCTDSPYLQNKVYPTNTVVINNCVNFAMNTANTAFICRVCKEGYIPSDPGHCVEKNAVPNCVQAKSSQQCSQCSDGFTVVNGLCTAKNIENCLTYDESPTATSLVCATCATNYFPSGSTCQLGNVVNCKVLKNANTCTECLPSFVLISIPLGKTYCYPIPSSFSCNAIDSAAFITNKYKCNTCKAGFVILTSEEDLAKSVCFNFTTISNCQNYTYAAKIQDSAFSCQTCANGYFLNGAVCQARNVTMRECVTYKAEKDECSVCEAGSFVSPDGKSCIKYPTGIKGCRIYKSLTECTACKTGLFFNKTRCDAVPTASQIAKCIYYADIATCILCEQGFAVSEGKCIQSQATNCLTFASKTACGSCYDRFGFKEDGGIRNCVAIEDKQCLIYQPFHPFKCTTCAAEFYPLNGICTAVTTTIENCQEYDSPSTCKKCKEGSALHFDKKACNKSAQVMRLFDQNCSELRWVFTPVCAKCKPSYFFSNNTCTKCTNSTIDNGCYNCNPKNQTLCYMCNTGFYQTKDSKCTKYSSGLDKQTNATNTTNTTNKTTATSSRFDVRILWLCLAIVMAVLK
jgi:hypothetical protein